LTVINITDASVYVNDTYNFTAQLLDQIGNPINATVLWNSSNTTVGTINESSGVFSALAGGDTMVTAANGSVNDSVVVNVTARVLTTINITTAVPDLLVDGQTLNFTADTFDQLNNTFSTSLIWNSSNTTVGTINASSGVFSALTGGDTMVTAANRSVNDSIVVNVTARMVTTINVSNASMYVGDTHSFKSETLDQFNNTFDALVNWASSDIAVGTIDVGTGLFTAHSAGTTTVTAANGSVKGNATATVSTLPAGDSGSSSSGAGGGGGTSGEAYENIVFKDAQTNIIIGGRTISYAFDTEENENDVEYINFSALRNSGRISTTIEVLKDTSTLVDEGVPGIVYRNFNIWVGNAAFGEDNIADPFIGFRVKRSWVTNNDIDISTIILYRNHDDEWVPLPTTIISENESYIYFKAATPGFSPFAISGEQMNDGQLVGHTKTNITSSIQQPLFENISTSSQKGNRDRSAFWSICVVTSILLVILSMVYLYNQKKETK
ncbi:MAG: PGF-pre-PGF domain-containing protein, partial [Euryarchaeota archaeon]|nr:PGF-pre-PGF domain-containing protein [Euryarchaeota archaeon]